MRGSTTWKVWLHIRVGIYSDWVCVATGSEDKCSETYEIFKANGSTVKLCEVHIVIKEGVTIKSEENSDPEGFAEFWEKYPRTQKVSRKAAISAYAFALKSVTPEIIIGSLIPFNKEHAETEEQYIPHPSTFLNKGLYACFGADEEINQEERRRKAWETQRFWSNSWGPNPYST